MINSKPNYKKVSEKASEILLLSNEIDIFPYQVSKVIQEFFDIEFKSYGEMEKKGIPRSFWLSQDAEFMEMNGICFIFFNERIINKHRMKFSVLHETGHYYMNHDLQKLRELKTRNIIEFKNLYEVYEKEANFFAASLLMPEQLLKEFAKRGCNINVEFLVKVFDVSKEAATIRMKMFSGHNWSSMSTNEDTFDSYIIEKYKSFISHIAPKNSVFSMEREYEMQAERDSWQ